MFSLAGWAPQIPAEFLVLRGTQVPARTALTFRVRGSHPLRPGFPAGFRYARAVPSPPVLQPPAPRCHGPGLGSCAFARRYLRNHCYFLFLRVLRCFSSPGSPGALRRHGRIAPPGFPHSDIRGSQGICPSPRLFAACHVLLRLREPQASPARPFLLSFNVLAFQLLLNHQAFGPFGLPASLDSQDSQFFKAYRFARSDSYSVNLLDLLQVFAFFSSFPSCQ